VPLPDGISFDEGATMGVCGLVMYQCLVKNVKKGDRVLINGGSGGTGTFAVQIAKALGCEVVTTCSGGLRVRKEDLKVGLLTPHRRECTAVQGFGSR
jgi:NADPH:quinone reductase-like Zn-dependent oxidoreductase